MLHRARSATRIFLGSFLFVQAALSQRVAAQEPEQPQVHPLDTLHVQVSRLRIGGIPVHKLPFGAQVLTYESLPENAVTAADLFAPLVGVTSADQFGSPLQPDLRFRGFQVSPVVGSAQSVGVFVDGVRVNEPDASQVNFNLIPLHAVERVEVVRTPGGPFGRNALAGSINLVTRSGGAGRVRGSLHAAGASFETGRLDGWLTGGDAEGVFYTVAGRYWHQTGWRDLSTSELTQAFGKLGYRWGRTDVWASYTFAKDNIEGPGSLPATWLAGSLPPELDGTDDPRKLQYTGGIGDIFKPRLHFVTLSAATTLGRDNGLQLVGFYRSNDFTQINDNITEPNVRGETEIESFGGTIQYLHTRPSGATVSAGLEYARNNVGINIFEEPNDSFPDAGGLTEDVVTGEDNVGLFAHLWSPISSTLGVTASLRYDYINLPITDNLDPQNSGENRFKQLTGSVGFDWGITQFAGVYASYGRGFRAPVILEITCADPEDPCPLPFELGADPPLEPVKTDTWQAGARFLAPALTRIELSAYWAEVYDDIFNVISLPSTRGFFRNLERTRRQGVELLVRSAPVSSVELGAGIALTRATFQTEATLTSALVEEEEGGAGGGGAGGQDEGVVEVKPGDQFSMVPALSFELDAKLSPGRWIFGAQGIFVGSQFYVGDEGNEEEFGKLDSYFVLAAEAQYNFGPFAIYASAANVFDNDYNSFGLISPNVRGPVTDPQPFLTPGLPFRFAAGIRVDF